MVKPNIFTLCCIPCNKRSNTFPNGYYTKQSLLMGMGGGGGLPSWLNFWHLQAPAVLSTEPMEWAAWCSWTMFMWAIHFPQSKEPNVLWEDVLVGHTSSTYWAPLCWFWSPRCGHVSLLSRIPSIKMPQETSSAGAGTKLSAWAGYSSPTSLIFCKPLAK